MTDLHIPATPVARGSDAGLNLDDSVYNRLLKDRIIILGSEVNDQVANRICAQLLLLAAEDPERDIILYINSPGGSVYARSEEHTSELQSQSNLVCRLLLEKKNTT